MRVPVFKGTGTIAYQQRPHPRIAHDDDVVVAVKACGICGTDLNILAVPPAHLGKENIVLGHEAIGVVHEIGSAVHRLKVGDTVVVAPRLTCGKCHYCRMGLDNQCLDYETIGTTRNGAFAPFVALPERALYPLSTTVTTENGVFFEPLSCAVGAVRRAPFHAGERVLIIGGGAMGLLFALLYRAMGASRVVVADISRYRLNFCRTLKIAPPIDAIDANTAPLPDQVQAILPMGADIVVDAVGNQMDTALNCVRRGGNIILFGMQAHNTQPVRQYTATRYDITLHGVFVGLRPFYQTIQLLENSIVHPSALITHRLPLDELAKGVALMRSGQAVKVIIVLACIPP